MLIRAATGENVTFNDYKMNNTNAKTITTASKLSQFIITKKTYLCSCMCNAIE